MAFLISLPIGSETAFVKFQGPRIPHLLPLPLPTTFGPAPPHLLPLPLRRPRLPTRRHPPPQQPPPRRCCGLTRLHRRSPISLPHSPPPRGPARRVGAVVHRRRPPRIEEEKGQTVEELYLSDSLPSDQQLLVAFSSFPDSMSHHHPRHRSSIHDSIFSFRFAVGGAFIYGYVFNRQRQDERLPHGGEQKLVVVLSHYPYSSVFRLLLQILCPLCFDIGRRPRPRSLPRRRLTFPLTGLPHGPPHRHCCPPHLPPPLTR